MNIKKIKSQINLQTIEDKISDFETNVDLELVPVITESSTDFSSVYWKCVAILNLLFLVLFAYGLNSHFENAYENKNVFIYAFDILVFSFFMAWLLSKNSTLCRLLTSQDQMQHSVENKAYQTFFHKRLFETKSHHGMILFISLLEKQIYIAPDPRFQFKGSKVISEKVLAVIQGHFKNKNYEKGLTEGIETLKNQLISQFPRQQKALSENELSNKLIWLDQ